MFSGLKTDNSRFILKWQTNEFVLENVSKKANTTTNKN